MRRWLHVAAEAAALLPASHLAQMHSDATNDDNVCVACGALIEGPAAELVVLQDARMVLARLAHPDCVKSGAYEWEGTTAAVQALTTRPGGLDVATLVAWRRAPSPRALVLIEPRIQVSFDAGPEDSLERLFARPLGLSPVTQPVTRLGPPTIPGELRDHQDGLELVTEALRVTIPVRSVLRQQWREHVDGGLALVLVGRGLGIGGSDEALLRTLEEALRSRPVWGAAVRVSKT